MPQRSISSGSYRYGFNGKENDNDVKGTGNQQDYGFRIYDPRLGRFLSVDPIAKQYPELTPYQFASNTPIFGIDLDGKELLGNKWLFDIWLEWKFGDPTGAKRFKEGAEKKIAIDNRLMPYHNDNFSASEQNKLDHINNIDANAKMATGTSQFLVFELKSWADVSSMIVPLGEVRVIAELKVAQGLTASDFKVMSQRVVDAVGNISDEIVVQGSRAAGTANKASDIDIAVKVSGKEFDQLIQKAFRTPNKGSAWEKTMQHAIKTGKIQAGEAGLSSLRKNLEELLGGMKVDISIIEKGGSFDNGAQIPVKGTKSP
jgi:RHS repeat-associated protein